MSEADFFISSLQLSANIEPVKNLHAFTFNTIIDDSQ